MKFAAYNSYIEQSKIPLVGMKTTKSREDGEHRRAAFTETQAKAILKYCDAQCGDGPVDFDRYLFSVFIQICLATGIRPGNEHQQIRWRDFEYVDADNNITLFLHVGSETKTGARIARCDPFLIGTLYALKKATAYGKDDDYVLADQKTGQAIKSFKRQFNTMLKALDVTTDHKGRSFTPYSLRHTYATLKLNHKVPLRIVALNMGTSDAMIQRQNLIRKSAMHG